MLHMTLIEFIKLSLKERALYVRQGMLIAGREHYNQKMLLYRLDNFYVEVTYDCNEQVITQLRPFNNTRLLEPYLEDISLTDLDL
jgi:hypothetical protein